MIETEKKDGTDLHNRSLTQGAQAPQSIELGHFFSSFPTAFKSEGSAATSGSHPHKDQLLRDTQLLSAMMDATPLGMIFWNRQMDIVACNTEALSLFDAEGFDELKENFFSFSPEIQPGGQSSLEKATDMIAQAFSGQKVRCYWQHCKGNGESMPTEVTIVRIPYLTDYLVASYTRDMREQRTLEEKVGQFNTRLEAILDASPLCLNLWNRQYDNIMCNKAAVKLFDLTDAQEYLERFFELSPEYQPDGSRSSEKAATYITQAFASGSAVQFEWLHQKLNGEKIPAEITLVKIEGLDENGGELVAGYTRDLREQKAMKEKIEKFNIRLEAILNATPLCLNLWNEHYQNMMCNNAAIRLFDLPTQQKYLEHFFELSPEYQPDGSRSSEKAASYIAQAFATGNMVQFQWMHQKLSGEEIPAEITLVKIEGLDEDGGDLVVGYTRDLRSQIASERLQQIISARIRAVLDSSPLSCILWSTDLSIIDCNEVAVTMLGAANKREVMENFDSFMPKYQPDGEASLDKKSRKFEETFAKSNINFEWVYLNKQGEEVPAQVTMVKIPLEKESIIVGYSRDLRELHYTLELNDRLSKMAYFDLLTGVSSRARFVEKLENDFALAPTDDSFALLLFDIDYFKQVNDTYGHEAGDIVLKRVAKFVEKTMPSNAFLGRFGGDEFIIQIQNINEKALSHWMSQIVQNVAAISFHYQDNLFSTSISMGGSFKTEADEDYHQLVNRADKALYEAKAQGRNCSVLL